MPSPAVVVGTGCAFPPSIEQGVLWDRFFADHFAGSRAARMAFSGSGVIRRGAIVDPSSDDLSEATTGARMERYAAAAPVLAEEAARAALADAGLAPEVVSLLVVASCTGHVTPGVDLQLAARLGLAATTQRVVLGHLGCHAALPALAVASDHVRLRGRPALLVCVELCSLHVQPRGGDLGQAVVHALFGDAAAAAVLAPAPLPRHHPGRGAPGASTSDERASPPADQGLGSPRSGRCELEVLEVASATAPGTSSLMSWTVTDRGFRMHLGRRVPQVVAALCVPLVDDLLERHHLDRCAVDRWVLHPGGPRILEQAGRALGLPDAACAPSAAVLAEHGNCSSATVLVVLDELARRHRWPEGGYGIVLAAGPGITAYAALVRDLRRGGKGGGEGGGWRAADGEPGGPGPGGGEVGR